MAESTDTKACSFVVGDDGLATWSDVHRDAWIGLLETHKRLTRALDAELEAEHGLTLSGSECLGRLAAAEKRAMRLTALAKATGLSLSRISRIVDLLESLNRESGSTVVLVTHDAALAARAGRIIRLRDGVVVEDTGDAGYGMRNDSSAAPGASLRTGTDL
jgi:ABC-type transport system involved in cytochrome bd biosynthesis fused ATPase/permease subunit